MMTIVGLKEEKLSTTSNQSVQRTLIIGLGELAHKTIAELPDAYMPNGALTNAVATVKAEHFGAEFIADIRRSLAGISRAAGRPNLITAGYELDRLHELALFMLLDASVVDDVTLLTDALLAVGEVAQEGWGMDTRIALIILAEDWTDKINKQVLRDLASSLTDTVDAIIPLNRVNELGLELDDLDRYLSQAASILEVLVATPLRDELQWSIGVQEPIELGPTLTTLGLARWHWNPETLQAQLASGWVASVIRQWLSRAGEAQLSISQQRGRSWFETQGLQWTTLHTALEPYLPPLHVPIWHPPYPWQFAHSLQRLQDLATAFEDGLPGSTELVFQEWQDWPVEQRNLLRQEVATLIDQEPAAALDLANGLLTEVSVEIERATELAEGRKDQLRESAISMAAEIRSILTEALSIVERWPGQTPMGFLSILLLPWRWPRMVWEYWTVHRLATVVVQLLQHQSRLERELVLIDVSILLYERLKSVQATISSEVEDLSDMLSSALVDLGSDEVQSDRLTLYRLSETTNAELDAAQAAAALGGLGRQLEQLDESIVGSLRELAQARFQWLHNLTAVDALQHLLREENAIEQWWHERWGEATPLWLYDDALQPEGSRTTHHTWTTVCAGGEEELRQLLSLPGGPDWRWLPGTDPRQILILRGRGGVAVH